MKKSYLLFLCVFILTGCPNVFKEMSPKDSDKALYYQAKMYIDSRDYTSAITTLNLLSNTYLARREVQGTLAGAYAGRCGLEMLTMINNMNNGTGGRLFQILFNAMARSTASKIADCVSAENVLKALGDQNNRTAEENLWMTFISLAKIGAVLNFDGDTNVDGTLDAAFDQCSNVYLSQAHANEIVTALSQFILSLTAAGSTIAGSQLTALNTICTSLNAGAPNICATTSTSNVTAAMRTAIRGVIGENQSVGLGKCVGDALTCSCGN